MRKRTKSKDLGNGNLEMSLFGATVTVAKSNYRKPTGRLKPYHLVKNTSVPPHLQGAVDKYLAIAKGLGIPHDRINSEVAEYLIKGYNEMAQKRAA